jgi:hypothetical protein
MVKKKSIKKEKVIQGKASREIVMSKAKDVGVKKVLPVVKPKPRVVGRGRRASVTKRFSLPDIPHKNEVIEKEMA